MNAFHSDTDLFDAFIRGDEKAIKQLYHLHYKPLCLFANRITGQIEEAEDLVGESFIKLLKKQTEFQNLANIKSFLYLVTKNACIDHLKAKGRHQNAHQQIRFLTVTGEEQEDAVREELLRLEVFQHIYAEIENLPDRCREIFKMIFVDGLSTDQVGAKLDISVQTVRNQKTRAVQLIKTQLLKKNLLPALLYLSLLFPSDRFSA